MPYQEVSACQMNNFGKCISIDKAYQEAITGKDQGGTKINGENETPAEASEDFYPEKEEDLFLPSKRELNYQKIQKITPANKAPIPLVVPAKIHRVFINRRTEDNVHYESFNVFYIDSPAKWSLDFQKPKSNTTHTNLELF
jgi:hypothetical protein